MKTDNNKLIAEFMGANGSPNYFSPEETLFDSDWNWLMTVVEKIENLEYIDRQGRFCVGSENFEENYTSYVLDRDNEFIQEEGETKIEAVYNACVGFINWYNKQKK